MPVIPVVIPVYAREDVFATVAFLRGQSYAQHLRFVIIDNGNAAELSARIKALEGADCQVVSFPENRGGSAAYIAGMEGAMKSFPDAPYVWLLDDDAKPDARTLPGLVETMDELVANDPKIASVGSAVVRPDAPDRIIECGADFSPLLAHAWPKLRGKPLSSVGEVTVRVDYAAACSLLVRTEAVRALGFWEDVFIHFDDIEWGLRATRAGWRNHATTRSVVRHPEFDPKKAGAWVCYFDDRNMYWLASRFGYLALAAVRVKIALKSLRDRLQDHSDRLPYRRLAWADFRQRIRRSRAMAVEAVKSFQ